jgi:hypothetical protein
MCRGLPWLTGLVLVLAAAACGAGGGTSWTISHQGRTYRDSAGWAIQVPPGWHTVHFSDSTDGITSAGVQLSNVQIPPPSLIPGFPVQASGQVLPAQGVALVIATDTDPKLSHTAAAMPPLPAPNGRYWTMGSASGGSPYTQTLWFRAYGAAFLACAKIGPRASSSDLRAVAAIVQSLH